MIESELILNEKTQHTLVFLLSNYSQVLNMFMTDPLTIILDDLWLLGYRIMFSCLYFHKGIIS